uniref:NADH-ubiquinone oxidoreductase chain 6 n=2 Tax=Zinaida TaxID=2057936 RepID=A0A0B5A0P9_ZINNA|nr:NADH dehydrogenase subunit 6 [Zinaida nascens]YP_009136714.1 NADH dehydrogenase subunit 6 [Zinaida jigongi]AJD80549.1 NADH dehydrogenase subunit 6 [Zinaida nascens]AKE07319.1 NADH dehydrogenase subunit 6 [Zinaida jigongi]
MKMFLSLNMIFISFIMIFLKHPLSMGLMILIQTLLICLISGMIINTYWFSYILFLTFLGGLLVLFIYVSSIASNELFYIPFNNKILFLFMFFIIIFISIMFMYNLNWLNLFINSYEMNNLFNYFMFFNNENNINLTKFYNKQTYLLMFMLIIYLFITLVAVVKITNIFYGPLRSN